jgi:hypothetical protein
MKEPTLKTRGGVTGRIVLLEQVGVGARALEDDVGTVNLVDKKPVWLDMATTACGRA